jgi:hypothetical protein
MAVARPVKVKGTGAAKLAPGTMVAPKAVVEAIHKTPNTRVRSGVRFGKGLGRAHVPRAGAKMPKFDVGSFNVQKQGPAQADPTAGIEQKVKRAIDQSGLGATAPTTPLATGQPAQQRQPAATTAPGSGYMGTGSPSQRTQATLPQSIASIGGAGTGGGQNQGPGGGPSSTDLTNAALGTSPTPSTPPAPGSGGGQDAGGRQYGQTGTNAQGGATLPGSFDYSGFSAANPPTMTAEQSAAAQQRANTISQTAMQQIQNPVAQPGQWEGGVPGSALNTQVMQALSALNAQRQAAANGGDWNAATWADLPENLRPPGAALPSFDVGTYDAGRPVTDYPMERMPYVSNDALLRQLDERPPELPLRRTDQDGPLSERTVVDEHLDRMAQERGITRAELLEQLAAEESTTELPRRRGQRKAQLPRFDVGTYDVGNDSYDTKLSPEEERAFQEWKRRYAPQDSGEDYDLRGAFRAGLTPDETGHWPDTFKKPNHETFSDESQYARGEDAFRAGHWDGDRFITPDAPRSIGGRPAPFHPRPLPQRARLPRFDVGTYGRGGSTIAEVHEGEEIYPPETASQIRSDPSIPSSGSVLGGRGGAAPESSASGRYAAGEDMGADELTSVATGGTTTSPDGARATTPAFGPGLPNSTSPATTPAAGRTPTPPPSGATLPDFLQRTADQLPNPNQIVARNWVNMDPNSTDLFKAGYESKGWSPSYIDWLIPQLLPGRAGVPVGTTGRILR